MLYYLLFFYLHPHFLSQTSYYVAKNRSNSNSGTSVSSPFLTISPQYLKLTLVIRYILEEVLIMKL